MSRSIGLTCAGVLVAGLSLGCTLDVDAERSATVERTGAVKQAFTGFKTFTWRQGNPSTVMVHKNDGMCFVTGLAGQFEGDGERAFQTLSGDFWVLHGDSQQSDVKITATCVSWADLNNLGGARMFWN